MGTSTLLNLACGIALLLWGLHMVQSGVLRAFGADLRRALSIALRNRVLALLAGLATTALLQSSTATGLMTASFVGEGIVGMVPALAIMLGANIGTTLIVQVFSFDVSAIAPVLLVIGVVAFKNSDRTRFRDLGRVSIGLGLMLLSLHILLDSLAPAENTPELRVLLAAITGMPVLDLLFGAGLAWAAHSSVAVVLLVTSLAYSNFITMPAALALVLGANLGSAINPLIEGSGLKNPVARRVPLGNMINRVIGCVLVLPFLTPAAIWLEKLESNPVRLIADFHTLFNVALAILFIGPLPYFAKLLQWLLPQPATRQDPSVPIYLDASAVSTPSLALTCAARETLHMGDLVEMMLKQSIEALIISDRKLVTSIEQMDNAVDRLHEAIKLYVTSITRETLDESEARRAMEIISFAINLEHIGDIIDKNLMELAAKKIRSHLQFSQEGASELVDFHRRVVDGLKLAQGVFMSGDMKIARQLVEEKVAIREVERTAAENHFSRLREGRTASIETSSLHLDVLRDFKRIFSHIAATAYPILEAAGELQPTRLKANDAGSTALIEGGAR
ncbi:MAG: Sodium-dependent phosphate transporter [Pseudolabrys sp.]|jgi:phosphate:Na+ symporter|nr:Sodium-dependent phosphate transporter [Pseudolabrys sp.]